MGTVSISMLEFRRDAEAILRKIQSGQRMVLTYRGKPVARLEPVSPQADSADDPFYQLASLADSKAEPLSNAEIDEILYQA